MSIVKEVDKNMWNEIWSQAYYIFGILFNKVIFIISLIFGVFLSAIGYPKEIFVFILTLVILDLLIKQYSIVVIKYNSFSLNNYKQAWVDRHLTSRAIKNGISVKTILYSPMLYIANTIGLLPQVLFGSAISNVLYTLLILTEVSSILESLIESGNTNLIPFMKFINRKKDEVSNYEEPKEK